MPTRRVEPLVAPDEPPDLADRPSADRSAEYACATARPRDVDLAGADSSTRPAAALDRPVPRTPPPFQSAVLARSFWGGRPSGRPSPPCPCSAAGMSGQPASFGGSWSRAKTCTRRCRARAS